MIRISALRILLPPGLNSRHHRLLVTMGPISKYISLTYTASLLNHSTESNYFTYICSKDYVYTNNNETFLGTKYLKLVFVQYTDATFNTPRSKTKDEETQGFIGPIIKVEVGETLTVVFRNQGRRPYSFHPEGLSYNRSDVRWKVKGNDQPVVAPGNTFTYHWTVAYGNGPGGGDSNCVTRVYYSDINVTADTHTGLIGPLVICR